MSTFQQTKNYFDKVKEKIEENKIQKKADKDCSEKEDTSGNEINRNPIKNFELFLLARNKDF